MLLKDYVPADGYGIYQCHDAHGWIRRFDHEGWWEGCTDAGRAAVTKARPMPGAVIGGDWSPTLIKRLPDYTPPPTPPTQLELF